MSTGKRAYDMLRGYVNHEWDRIQGVFEARAESELQESLDMPYRPAATAEPNAPVMTILTEDRARQILGVQSDADFDGIQAAFEKLNQRSNPANFPVGSAEAKQAADIQRNVHQAYNLLTKDMDATERRFRSLDID